MSDLIDRQKAVDAVLDLSEKMKNEMLFIDAIVDEIENLPSAEPERKWIPCSERLPDWDEHRDDMVLVCYGNGSIRFDTCMNGEWVHGNPIAWMPLPERYRGE